MATQFFTQERSLRPMRIRMWLASRSSCPGAANARSVRSASSGVQNSSE